MSRLLTRAKTFVPRQVRDLLKGERQDAGGVESEIGDYLIDAARLFSASRNGDPTAFDRDVLNHVLGNKVLVKQASEALQFLQTAFQADYQNNLYPYYQQQQFMLLLAFLSYPRRGPGALKAQILPYNAAADQLGEMHILDYGAGIPFGLINLIRSRPGKIRSVTLCDLDLIHAKFTQFVIEGLLGAENVTVFHTQDPNTVPTFGRKFNFVFGKDIFEHLREPEKHLRNILASCLDRAVSYLDFTDHGEQYLQHVTPLLSPLRKVMLEHGFNAIPMVANMSGWDRTEAPAH